MKIAAIDAPPSPPPTPFLERIPSVSSPSELSLVDDKVPDYVPNEIESAADRRVNPITLRELILLCHAEYADMSESSESHEVDEE